jgi:hypothetical protein
MNVAPCQICNKQVSHHSENSDWTKLSHAEREQVIRLVRRCVVKGCCVRIRYRDGETYAYPQFGGAGGVCWGYESMIEDRIVQKRGVIFNPAPVISATDRLFEGAELNFPRR